MRISIVLYYVPAWQQTASHCIARHTLALYYCTSPIQCYLCPPQPGYNPHNCMHNNEDCLQNCKHDLYSKLTSQEMSWAVTVGKSCTKLDSKMDVWIKSSSAFYNIIYLLHVLDIGQEFSYHIFQFMVAPDWLYRHLVGY